MKTRNTTRLRRRLRLSFLTLTLTLTFTSVFSQIYNYTPDYRFNNHLEAGSFKVSSSLTLPDTLASAPLNSVAVNSGIVYLKTQSGWIAINAASVNLTNFLLKSDTAAMLAHYMHYIDTASLSNRINQIKSTSFTATNLVPHDGLYIDGNNIGVYNYNAQWDAKWLQKVLLSSVQPLDQQTLIYNAAKQQAEWGFLGGTSNGTGDGNNYLSNLYLDTDSLKASVVGMTGFNIDLSQRFVNKQLLQSYITYVLDSTTQYFDSTYFTGAGTNLNPYSLKLATIGGSTPEDIEFTAGATGKPAAGASTITFTGSTGYEVRVIRGTVPQSTINKGDGFYYTKASNSETLTLGQPLVSGEYVRIIFYKPSGTVTY